MKNLYFIIYLPGYAGFFLRFLFSLDITTFPWVYKNKPLNEEERLNGYYYDKLQANRRFWQYYHRQITDSFQAIDMFINSDYHTQINIWHPKDFYQNLHDSDYLKCISKDSVNIHYLVVDLSQQHHDSMYTVTRAQVRENEYEQNQTYKQLYNPFVINLDNFLSSDHVFINEYERINQYLNLPNYHDRALSMFKTWRLARQL